MVRRQQVRLHWHHASKPATGGKSTKAAIIHRDHHQLSTGEGWQQHQHQATSAKDDLDSKIRIF